MMEVIAMEDAIVASESELVDLDETGDSLPAPSMQEMRESTR